jgi:hypothetical protein
LRVLSGFVGVAALIRRSPLKFWFTPSIARLAARQIVNIATLAALTADFVGFRKSNEAGRIYLSRPSACTSSIELGREGRFVAALRAFKIHQSSKQKQGKSDLAIRRTAHSRCRSVAHLDSQQSTDAAKSPLSGLGCGKKLLDDWPLPSPTRVSGSQSPPALEEKR